MATPASRTEPNACHGADMSSRRDTGGGRRPWKRYSASQASSGSASTSTPAVAPATAPGAAVMTVAAPGRTGQPSSSPRNRSTALLSGRPSG